MVDKLYETDPDGCCEIYKVAPACGVADGFVSYEFVTDDFFCWLEAFLD